MHAALFSTLARTMSSARSHTLPQMCVLLLLAAWAPIVRAGELCVCWVQSVAVAHVVHGVHCGCSQAACGLVICTQTNAWSTAAWTAAACKTALWTRASSLALKFHALAAALSSVRGSLAPRRASCCSNTIACYA